MSVSTTRVPPLQQRLGDGEADRPGADDQGELAGLRLGALHGMPTDPERLDERQGIEIEPGTDVQQPSGNHEAFAHPAVDRHPEEVEALAAVGSSATAREAGSAGQVGEHGAVVARTYVADIGSDVEDLDGELVAEHPGVGEEVLVAGVGVVVGAAQSDPACGDEGLRRAGGVRFALFEQFQHSWTAQDHTVHVLSLSCPLTALHHATGTRR